MATGEVGRLLVVGRAEGAGDRFLTLGSVLCGTSILSGTITESVALDPAASSWRLSINRNRRSISFAKPNSVRTCGLAAG